MDQAMQADLERAHAVARAIALPEVTRGTWYRTPALQVAGKSFCRVREPGILVLLCPIEEKELLIAQRPEVWFETDHYRGWPAVLLRLSAADDDDLRTGLLRAWRQKAPKRLQARYAPPRRPPRAAQESNA